MKWSVAAKKLKALVFDVDGVLTDGRLGYGPDGIVKFFDARDGHAIKLALRAGLRVGLLSGREDPATQRRALDLELSFCYTGAKDKRAAFRRLLVEQRLQAAECLYVGDDVVDLPVMRQVGVAVAVPDAVPEARAAAHWVTVAAGGRGAVREVIVRVLKTQGHWPRLLARYLDDPS